MTDEQQRHSISCPRFGGTRFATACVHYDRYRGCRRGCPDLAKHMKEFPNLVEIAKEWFANHDDKPIFAAMSSKFSGKGVADPQLRCRYCRFVGKSPRGLRIHYSRTHGVKKDPAK